jgi:hypothetical protein
MPENTICGMRGCELDRHVDFYAKTLYSLSVTSDWLLLCYTQNGGRLNEIEFIEDRNSGRFSP